MFLANPDIRAAQNAYNINEKEPFRTGYKLFFAKVATHQLIHVAKLEEPLTYETVQDFPKYKEDYMALESGYDGPLFQIFEEGKYDGDKYS